MREEGVNKLEVHVTGICMHEGKVLTGKRAPTRRLYPNLWDCSGGQVRLGENFEEAVKRQFIEEFGAIVTPIIPSGTYQIRTPELPQKKIPDIKFVCKLESFINGKEPQLSEEHTERRWQELDKLDEIEFIPGIIEDIKTADRLLTELKIH